jgi:hypothetical protein
MAGRPQATLLAWQLLFFGCLTGERVKRAAEACFRRVASQRPLCGAISPVSCRSRDPSSFNPLQRAVRASSAAFSLLFTLSATPKSNCQACQPLQLTDHLVFMSCALIWHSDMPVAGYISAQVTIEVILDVSSESAKGEQLLQPCSVDRLVLICRGGDQQCAATARSALPCLSFQQLQILILQYCCRLIQL